MGLLAPLLFLGLLCPGLALSLFRENGYPSFVFLESTIDGVDVGDGLRFLLEESLTTLVQCFEGHPYDVGSTRSKLPESRNWPTDEEGTS